MLHNVQGCRRTCFICETAATVAVETTTATTSSSKATGVLAYEIPSIAKARSYLNLPPSMAGQAGRAGRRASSSTSCNANNYNSLAHTTATAKTIATTTQTRSAITTAASAMPSISRYA